MIKPLQSIELAANVFKRAGVKSFRPQRQFKNCNVEFVKTGVFNGEPEFKKIVTTNDGRTITGFFNGTYCTGVEEISAAGKISTTFGGENYDKVTQIIMNDGRYLNRLGHKNKPKRFLDYFMGPNGIYGANSDGGNEYNKLIAEIRKRTPQNKYKVHYRDDILNQLREEWKQSGTKGSEKEKDSFLEFCKRWAK